MVPNLPILLQIEPPFKPQVMSETDTRYFDSEFTGESVELTPPDADGPTDISTITEVDETTFPGFSYQVSLPEGPHQVGSLSLNPALHLTWTEDYLQLRMFNFMIPTSS